MKTFKVNYITNPEFGRTDNGNPGPLEKEAANKVRQNILANIAAFNQKNYLVRSDLKYSLQNFSQTLVQSSDQIQKLNYLTSITMLSQFQ